MAVAVQVVSPQRHDAVAHQKRQHNERGKPPDDKPCDLFFRCGQPERPVGAHCADDHHEHELENRKRIFTAEECANIHEYVLVFYSGFQTVSISERKRSSLGVMTFCVKWYLPNKRQIRTHPRLGTSSDFVVLCELNTMDQFEK